MICMSYETAIANLLEISTHKHDYDSKAKYPYYVSANDSFFDDKQIILCKSYEDAKHVKEALNLYNYQHRNAMKKPYTYVSIGTTSDFRMNPRQKYGILFDNANTWWNRDQPYASLKGCKTTPRKKSTARKTVRKTVRRA